MARWNGIDTNGDGIRGDRVVNLDPSATACLPQGRFQEGKAPKRTNQDCDPGRDRPELIEKIASMLFKTTPPHQHSRLKTPISSLSLSGKAATIPEKG